MKNLVELHQGDKELSAVSLFKGETGLTTAIHLRRDGTLKEHQSKTAALLLCVAGMVIYEDENGQQMRLTAGDYVDIVPNVKHWLLAKETADLLLLK